MREKEEEENEFWEYDMKLAQSWVESYRRRIRATVGPVGWQTNDRIVATANSFIKTTSASSAECRRRDQVRHVMDVSSLSRKVKHQP